MKNAADVKITYAFFLCYVQQCTTEARGVEVIPAHSTDIGRLVCMSATNINYTSPQGGVHIARLR